MISVENCKNFATPIYFVHPLTGFPWNWVLAHGVKKPEGWGYHMVKSFKISLTI